MQQLLDAFLTVALGFLGYLLLQWFASELGMPAQIIRVTGFIIAVLVIWRVIRMVS